MVMTKARKELLDLFETLEYPVTADIVYEKLNKNYDLSTIYRNLNYFEDNNLLRSMIFSDKNKYYYSGKGHFHFIYCIKCHKFQKFDICFSSKMKEYIENNLKFKVLDHVLYFEGLCDKCKYK